ncbi:MAG TPA: hypothetical protein VFZ66_09410 [Herpetosiphonaceae bacterium]
MLSSRFSPSLRRALLADALISAATGLLMVLGSSFLTSFLDLPESLLRYAGLILIPYSALVGYIATREQLNRTAVWAVIVMNALWATDSIVLLLSGWVDPNLLGYSFVIVQAAVVALFAELQYLGVRKRMTTIA